MKNELYQWLAILCFISWNQVELDFNDSTNRRLYATNTDILGITDNDAKGELLSAALLATDCV